MPKNRRDPVQILIDQGRDRLQNLLPIRYERMRADPFAFLRGAAAIMAADLVHTPTTGLLTQCCGDAHLSNFGSYAAPDGLVVFDVNDFDETLPASFEWDVKRLAASFVVTARVQSISERAARKLAQQATEAYREHMAQLAEMAPVDAWSSPIDLKQAMSNIDGGKLRTRIEKRLEKVLDSGAAQFGLVEHSGGTWRIRDKLPLVNHVDSQSLNARRAFSSYAKTLEEDRRVLLAPLHAAGCGVQGGWCRQCRHVLRDRPAGVR